MTTIHGSVKLSEAVACTKKGEGEHAMRGVRGILGSNFTRRELRLVVRGDYGMQVRS